jgi:Methionine biosynthesis protein MetW
MAEWKLFDGDVPHVSTREFHADRPRAPHLEQPQHRPRLERAAEYVLSAADLIGPEATVSDLGCGDGGLLSLIKPIASWGYDFAPANAAGWTERGVTATQLDVFGADRDQVEFGDVTCVTEGGFTLLHHQKVGNFQVVLGWRADG